jgi:hypothetical protein
MTFATGFNLSVTCAFFWVFSKFPAVSFRVEIQYAHQNSETNSLLNIVWLFGSGWRTWKNEAQSAFCSFSIEFTSVFEILCFQLNTLLPPPLQPAELLIRLHGFGTLNEIRMIFVESLLSTHNVQRNIIRNSRVHSSCPLPTAPNFYSPITCALSGWSHATAFPK